MPDTSAMGRYSMAPAATLVTVGDRWTERCLGSTMPVTPAHSALRSTDPRLCGSVTAVEHEQEREPAPLRGLAQRLQRGLLDRPGQGDDALGPSVRATASMRLRDT